MDMEVELTRNPIVAATTPECDWEIEVISELMEFFLTLFHNIIHHRAGLPKDNFFFTEIYGLRFPICLQTQIASYLEFCTKKIVGLLVSGYLEGFQVEFYERNQAVQRYIGIIDGKLKLLIDSMDGSGYPKLITEIREEARRLLLQYNEVAFDIPRTGKGSNHGQPNITRIKITIGVEGDAVRTFSYQTGGGSIVEDIDSDIFPWSKPKKKITCRDVGSQFKKTPVLKFPRTPTKLGSEQTLRDDLFFVKSPGSFGTPLRSKSSGISALSLAMTPPLNILSPKLTNSPSGSGKSPITPITRAVSNLKAPALFPIETIEFGPITLCFYVLTYYRKKPEPTTRRGYSAVRSKSSSSLMSPSNLCSPGFCPKRTSSGRENELLTRTPPGIVDGIRKPTSGSKIYSKSPRDRILKSSRSLVSSFEKSQFAMRTPPRSKGKIASSWEEFRARMN